MSQTPIYPGCVPPATDGRGAAKRPVLDLFLDFQSWTDRSFLMPFKKPFCRDKHPFSYSGFLFFILCLFIM